MNEVHVKAITELTAAVEKLTKRVRILEVGGSEEDVRRSLNSMKEAAVEDMEFDRAARYRDAADCLHPPSVRAQKKAMDFVVAAMSPKSMSAARLLQICRLIPTAMNDIEVLEDKLPLVDAIVKYGKSFEVTTDEAIAVMKMTPLDASVHISWQMAYARNAVKATDDAANPPAGGGG